MQFENRKTFKVMTPVPKKDGSTFWMRIGTGYPGKDGALNLYLDALPTSKSDGKTMIYVREMDERDFERRNPDAPRADRLSACSRGTDGIWTARRAYRLCNQRWLLDRGGKQR